MPSRNRWVPTAMTSTTPIEVTTSQIREDTSARGRRPVEGAEGEEEKDDGRREIGEEVPPLGELEQRHQQDRGNDGGAQDHRAELVPRSPMYPRPAGVATIGPGRPHAVGLAGRQQGPHRQGQSGQKGQDGQREKADDGVAGECAEVESAGRPVDEHRRGLGGAGGLGPGGPPPGGEAARLTEREGHQPHGHCGGTGCDGHQQLSPPTGRGHHGDEGKHGERFDDRLPEAGQEPESDGGGHAVPAARSGAPGQNDEKRARHHVERVGGDGGAAEPSEGTGGDHQSGRHAHPRSAQVPAGHHGQAGGDGRCQGGHDDQAVDGAEAGGGVHQTAGHHEEPVTGRLGLPVGHVEMADRRGVLGRVPVGRAVGRRGQPKDQRGHSNEARSGQPVVRLSRPSSLDPGRGGWRRRGRPGGYGHDPGRCRHDRVHGSGYRGQGRRQGYTPRTAQAPRLSGRTLRLPVFDSVPSWIGR